MNFFRNNISRMSAYQPGEQPAPGAKVVKLNTNENPYPPSPRAMQALRALDGDLLRRYPHPYARQVRQAVGEIFGVPEDWVLVGNGSDDLLTMLLRATAEPGRKVVFPMPTYVLYRTLAEIQDAPVVEVPFDEDYNLPTDALASENGAVTIVASPNSPSGTRFDNAQLAALAGRLRGLLVIDEAYADFASDNALSLARELPNVLVLRTLSKGYSLAGLRVGFGIARPEILAGLAKVKDSYNVDAAACVVAAAAIRDQAWKNANAAKVTASRAVLSDALRAMGWKVWPSEANFLLARPPAGDAKRLYEALKDRGILVRYFQQPRLDDKLRITVGSDEQNAALLAALRENKK
ncbi:MAG TPA: histidinol-phosphate transaminase [Phycisphaerales bacterium]|nr:histidinol-phosphate transaminase [Phycisphaerales bacterium]